MPKLLYQTPAEWRASPRKRVAVFGMSGLGKTRLACLLRDAGEWFHYSIDYRIGTAYMGEHIEDHLKLQAMQVPFLRDLLRSDSIYIRSNISFENLSPLSTYLGKPGNPDLGGVPFEEYMRRQALHRRAEVNSLLDTPNFITRAQRLYGYDHFICDTGGSICEVVNPADPTDEVLTTLSANCLMIRIEETEAHTDELIARFKKAPKPMYYQPEFLRPLWEGYLAENDLAPDAVDPDAFVRFAYAKALAHRAPLYRAMADNWGITVAAAEVEAVRDATDAEDMIAEALGRTAPVT